MIDRIMELFDFSVTLRGISIACPGEGVFLHIDANRRVSVRAHPMQFDSIWGEPWPLGCFWGKPSDVDRVAQKDSFA